MTSTFTPLYLGIDAGGTHCRVRLENSEGILLGRGEAGTGHPLHGMDTVSRNLLNATNIALSQAGIPKANYDRIIAAGGYAGAHLKRFYDDVSDWHHPFFAHYVTTDLHTACFGALEGKDGGVVIMGTGFSAMSYVRGQTKFIGGHGFLLGDVACGGWLGLQAVKLALAYRDGMTQHSKVVDLVESMFGASGSELADKMIFAKPNEFARCAKEIFELGDGGDEAAMKLIEQAVNDASKVIEKLSAQGCEHITVCGSFGKRLSGYMSSELQTKLVTPAGTAEQGAIWFARQKTTEACTL